MFLFFRFFFQTSSVFVDVGLRPPPALARRNNRSDTVEGCENTIVMMEIEDDVEEEEEYIDMLPPELEEKKEREVKEPSPANAPTSHKSQVQKQRWATNKASRYTTLKIGLYSALSEDFLKSRAKDEHGRKTFFGWLDGPLADGPSVSQLAHKVHVLTLTTLELALQHQKSANPKECFAMTDSKWDNLMKAFVGTKPKDLPRPVQEALEFVLRTHQELKEADVPMISVNESIPAVMVKVR